MKPLSFSEKAGNTIPKQIWNTKILNASIILVLSELTNKCKNVPLFLLIGLIGVDGLPGLILLKQHFTPGLVGTSTQWARCPGDVLIRGPNWPSGFLLTPRSVELRQKAPLKVPHCTCEAKSLEEPHFSRWYPQPGPFESLPPEHVIADKGHGVNQELFFALQHLFNVILSASLPGFCSFIFTHYHWTLTIVANPWLSILIAMAHHAFIWCVGYACELSLL